MNANPSPPDFEAIGEACGGLEKEMSKTSGFRPLTEQIVQNMLDRQLEMLNRHMEQIKNTVDRQLEAVDRIENTLDNQLEAATQRHKEVIASLDALDEALQRSMKSLLKGAAA